MLGQRGGRAQSQGPCADDYEVLWRKCYTKRRGSEAPDQASTVAARRFFEIILCRSVRLFRLSSVCQRFVRMISGQYYVLNVRTLALR